uniref:Uncharacterized protein n=1 Tax=Xenopus tropicalis TaxID=8364 RepID=A0A1B8YA09_XENTR
MGEYAGSDKLYHQWLSTVKKGSGAFINTMKTRANPAMKTVYKFAKDHAKMGIKEVKNRLKQKDMAENGFSTSAEEPLPQISPSSSIEKKRGEERRPITVHFGQCTCEGIDFLALGKPGICLLAEYLHSLREVKSDLNSYLPLPPK